MRVHFERCRVLVSLTLAGILACLLLGVAGGCSGGLGAKASGRVTLDGKPITTGNVTFTPQQTGVPGYGAIDTSGHYSITTNGRAGLAPGEYIVTVVAREPAVAASPGDMPIPGKAIAPERYASPETSGLKRTVTRGANQLDLELKSNP